jgi:hypothetical protein
MKMGNIVSPWRYDAAACRAIQSAMLRAPAILYYAFARCRRGVESFT